MEPPHVDPVGILRRPAGYAMRVRTYSGAQRGLAIALLSAFAFVVVATTVLSLGAYCLTSDGENSRGLPHRAPIARTR